MEENNNNENNESNEVEFEEFESDSKFHTFVANYGGAVIGAVIALLLLVLRIYHLIIWLAIIALGAFVGNYIQKNKEEFKFKLKSFIDKF